MRAAWGQALGSALPAVLLSSTLDGGSGNLTLFQADSAVNRAGSSANQSSVADILHGLGLLSQQELAHVAGSKDGNSEGARVQRALSLAASQQRRRLELSMPVLPPQAPNASSTAVYFSLVTLEPSSASALAALQQTLALNTSQVFSNLTLLLAALCNLPPEDFAWSAASSLATSAFHYTAWMVAPPEVDWVRVRTVLASSLAVAAAFAAVATCRLVRISAAPLQRRAAQAQVQAQAQRKRAKLPLGTPALSIRHVVISIEADSPLQRQRQQQQRRQQAATAAAATASEAEAEAVTTFFHPTHGVGLSPRHVVVRLASRRGPAAAAAASAADASAEEGAVGFPPDAQPSPALTALRIPNYVSQVDLADASSGRRRQQRAGAGGGGRRRAGRRGGASAARACCPPPQRRRSPPSPSPPPPRPAQHHPQHLQPRPLPPPRPHPRRCCSCHPQTLPRRRCPAWA